MSGHKIFVDTKFCLTQNFFGHKILVDPKSFLTKNVFLIQCFFTQNILDQKIFGRTQKAFYPKTFLDPKIFWSQHFFGSNIFVSKNSFGPNIFLDPTFFYPTCFWTQNVFVRLSVPYSFLRDFSDNTNIYHRWGVS